MVAMREFLAKGADVDVRSAVRVYFHMVSKLIATTKIVIMIQFVAFV